MKKLTALLIITVAVLAALYFAVPAMMAPPVYKVSVRTLYNGIFYESIPCSGVLAPMAKQNLSLGTPSTVLMVHVQEGDVVKKGDILITFRPLVGENALNNLTALYPAELAAYLAEAVSSDGGILGAAEYYSKTGELPDYFLDFYLPEAVTAFRDGSAVLLSPIDGTVTRLRVSAGDIVTGAFASVTIADLEHMVALVQVPERHAGKLQVGQLVNVYSSLIGADPLPGQIASISHEVRTIGGLLSGAENVLECTVSLPESPSLRPGFSVQTYIFLSVHRGILLPYEAVRQDNNGDEYVFVVREGRAVRQDFTSKFENNDGILPNSGFFVGEQVILNPPDDLEDGHLVTIMEG
ncbi:MAG TPA: efflux RND transporter periplasmic adaptor subunit [Clostridiales bacterium]|jgi:multidrug efflux pump subunit AcrA (membrane-fusion protein)|nr:efflux RND transporter periplasmic adaptor subunit [Clostridiales bacterium]